MNTTTSSANRFRFRAWDAEHKVMSESFAMFTHSILFEPEPGNSFQNYLVCPDEDPTDHLAVMQSTGLTDTAGKEIFEGDIIRWDDASKGEYWRVAQVVWSDCGCWCFRTIPSQCVNCLKDESHDFEMGRFIYTPHTGADGNVLEVIGDIYRNPDLLPKA